MWRRGKARAGVNDVRVPIGVNACIDYGSNRMGILKKERKGNGVRKGSDSLMHGFVGVKVWRDTGAYAGYIPLFYELLPWG